MTVFESLYLKHSGKTGIDPTHIPVIDVYSTMSSDYFHIVNVEIGLLVNRFKISYLIKQPDIFGDVVANSHLTYPIQPIGQLVVVWQFWN